LNFIFKSRLGICAFSSLFLSINLSSAATILVPSQYSTIQAGINAALVGDTVLAAEGIYTGLGNKNIDFLGKAIVVSSESGAETCIIDCQNEDRGFYFHTGEDTNSLLKGFTIRGGNAEDGGGIFCSSVSPIIDSCILAENTVEDYGGGIYCYFAPLIIRNCLFYGNSCGWDGAGIFLYCSDVLVENSVFRKNSAFFAGGIWSENSDPMITNCVFEENNAAWDGGGILIGFYSQALVEGCRFYRNNAWRGGGIWCHKSDFSIQNCLICDNTADCGGGMILYWQSDNVIKNCTITGNSASSDGGGIHCSYSNAAIVNTIVSGNFGNGGLYCDVYTDLSITYGDYWDNEGGNFTGPAVPAGLGQIVSVNANGDSCDIYHNIFLDPEFTYPQAGIYNLLPSSPCIDAGDPDSPMDPDSTVADMGAFYFNQNVSIVQDLIISVEDNNVVLCWTPISTGFCSYNIYRSDTPYFDISTMSHLASVIETEYIDNNAVLLGNGFYCVTVETE